MTFWQTFLLVAEIFLLVAYVVVLFHIVADVFRDTTTRGAAKALWVFFLIALPVLTALLYLVVRGGGMAERQRTAATQARQRAEEYIRDAAGFSPSQEVARAKQLLDDGTIDAAEFARLKAHALAAA